MKVVQVRNPNALGIPEVQNLLRRGIESDKLLAPAGWDVLAVDLFRFITQPKSFMVLGAEKGEYKSFVIGYFPAGNLFPYPTTVLFYNEGSKELLEATKAKLLEVMVENGYNKMLAVNHTGRSDKAWMKVLTPEGATSEIIGSLAMFKTD